MCWGGEGGQVVFFLWEFSLSHSLSLQAEAEKLSDCTDMSYMFGSVQIFYKIEVFWIDHLQLGWYLLPMEFALFWNKFQHEALHARLLKINFVKKKLRFFHFCPQVWHTWCPTCWAGLIFVLRASFKKLLSLYRSNQRVIKVSTRGCNCGKELWENHNLMKIMQFISNWWNTHFLLHSHTVLVTKIWTTSVLLLWYFCKQALATAFFKSFWEYFWLPDFNISWQLLNHMAWAPVGRKRQKEASS